MGVADPVVHLTGGEIERAGVCEATADGGASCLFEVLSHVQDWRSRSVLQMPDAGRLMTIAVGAVRTGGVAPRHLVEGRPGGHGTLQVGVGQLGQVEDGTREIGASQVGPGQVGLVEDGTREVGASQVGPGQVGLVEDGTREVGASQVGPGQVGLAQVGASQVGPGQVEALKVATGQRRGRLCG